MSPRRPNPRTAFAKIALALLLLGSAGCLGGTNPPEITKTSSTEANSEVLLTLDEAGNALGRFDLAKSVDTTLWFNGSYRVEEHFFPVHFIPGALGVVPAPGIRLHDISEHVPRGVPMRIIAEVNADVTDGDVDLWIDAPFEEIWSGTWDTPRGGYSRIELRVVHASDEPVSVGLFYDEIDRSAEFSYALRVDIQADPERLVGGVGATLDVPIEAAMLLVTLESAGQSPALLVWDPEKKFLGRFDLAAGTTKIPLAQPGEHFLMLSQTSGDATAAVEGVSEPPVLDVAVQEIEMFEAEAAGPEVAWSFDADRVPLQVGFFAESGTVADDFSGSLESPAGVLIDRERSGGPWVRPFMGFGTFEWTEMGAAGLVEGQYDVNVAFGTSAGPDPIRYGHFVVYISAS